MVAKQVRSSGPRPSRRSARLSLTWAACFLAIGLVTWPADRSQALAALLVAGLVVPPVCADLLPPGSHRLATVLRLAGRVLLLVAIAYFVWASIAWLRLVWDLS